MRLLLHVIALRSTNVAFLNLAFSRSVVRRGVAVQSVGLGAEFLILPSGPDGADLPPRWIWAQANLQLAATAGAP
jgi:hypothetical protein